MPREKKIAEEGIEGKSTPTRHILNDVGLHVLNKKKRFFFPPILSLFFYIVLVLLPQHNRAEVCMWAAFGGLVRKALQSQVFVSISAGINRLSRKRSRPKCNYWARRQNPPHVQVFLLSGPIAFIFFLYLFFFKNISEAQSNVCKNKGHTKLIT